jgi:hypothetical protein
LLPSEHSEVATSNSNALITLPALVGTNHLMAFISEPHL